MPSTIRPATTDDHGAIGRIAAEVGALHAHALPGRFRSVLDPLTPDHFRFLLDSPDHEVLVAERDGRVVGYESLELRETPDVPIVLPRRYVLIHEIGVLTPERGQGVGRLLIDAAVRWAGERGATGVELQVYTFNERAIAFYEHLGFHTVKQTMALLVDPD